MKLTDKLITEQEIRSALADSGITYYDACYKLMRSRQFTGTQKQEDVAPWAVREVARLERNVYEVTDQLIQVNVYFPVFAHVSLVDKTQVAFTPDKVSGMADRQVSMAAGRFFSKIYPLLTDNAVRLLTEAHLAEASCEVEWITGPEIAETYSRMPSGLSACMSNKTFEVQPTVAYDTPKIKMAVMRRDGKLTSRCMVYEASDTDKRWIRAYGDAKIVKKLEDLGYRCGSWEGATFNTVPLPEKGEDVYVIPYLDTSGSRSITDSCSLIVYKTQIWCVPQDKLKKLRAIGVTPTVPSAQGWAVIPTVEEEALTVKDCLTGEGFSVLEHAATGIWYSNSTEPGAPIEDGLTCKSEEELEADGYDLAAHYATPRGRVTRHTKLPTFVHNDLSYVECATNRMATGHYQLPAEYGYTNEWRQFTYSVPLVVAGSSTVITRASDLLEEASNRSRIIPKSDAVFIVGIGYAHKSSVQKGYVKLHKDTAKGVDGYAISSASVFFTSTNRKVHPDYNSNIALAVDGKYEFMRNLSYNGSYNGVSYRARDIEHFLKGIADVVRPALIQHTHEFPMKMAQDVVRRAGRRISLRPPHSTKYTHFRTELRTSAVNSANAGLLLDVVDMLMQLSYTLITEEEKLVLSIFQMWAAEALAMEYPIRAEDGYVQQRAFCPLTPALPTDVYALNRDTPIQMATLTWGSAYMPTAMMTAATGQMIGITIPEAMVTVV